MQSQRLNAIDALRGVAIVWMTLYHFGFDLNQFGYLKQDFYRDPFWTLQRTVILSLFLFCAGLGQAVAHEKGLRWPDFWRRWARVAGCAVLVTAGSYLMFPRSFIYFGVLHGIALMLVIARFTASWGNWLWALGLIAIAAQFVASSLLEGSQWAAWFNSPALNWLGLITRKPITEDYVPLVPWLGLMWWGLACGSWLAKNRPAVLAWQAPVLNRQLALLGRWSLAYYMLHQPVMIGSLLLAGLLSR